MSFGAHRPDPLDDLDDPFFYDTKGDGEMARDFGGHSSGRLGSGNISGSLLVVEPSPGALHRAWEGFRDLCYIVQDSKIFQHLTTAMILCNAVVLAITWCVIVLLILQCIPPSNSD